jgi:hypothetical protein
LIQAGFVGSTTTCVCSRFVGAGSVMRLCVAYASAGKPAAWPLLLSVTGL